MKLPLTRKQVETIDFIKEFYAEKKYMPRYIDIALRLGISVGGPVNSRIRALLKKGYLKKVEGHYGLIINTDE